MSGENERDAIVLTVRLSTPLTGRPQNAPSRTSLVIEELRDVST